MYLMAAALAFNLHAQTNELADQIPPLRPPHVEIPPTWWDEHRAYVFVGSALALILLSAIIWLLTRPKAPPVLPPPASRARHDLELLSRQPEDGILLSRVSQIVRRYLTAALKLPPGEMTTSDICVAVIKDERFGDTLSAEVKDFLRACDERKFAPPQPAPAMQAVPHALKIIEASEARLEQLRHAALAAAGNSNG